MKRKYNLLYKIWTELPVMFWNWVWLVNWMKKKEEMKWKKSRNKKICWLFDGKQRVTLFLSPIQSRQIQVKNKLLHNHHMQNNDNYRQPNIHDVVVNNKNNYKNNIFKKINLSQIVIFDVRFYFASFLNHKNVLTICTKWFYEYIYRLAVQMSHSGWDQYLLVRFMKT